MMLSLNRQALSCFLMLCEIEVSQSIILELISFRMFNGNMLSSIGSDECAWMQPVLSSNISLVVKLNPNRTLILQLFL